MQLGEWHKEKKVPAAMWTVYSNAMNEMGYFQLSLLFLQFRSPDDDDDDLSWNSIHTLSTAQQRV